MRNSKWNPGKKERTSSSPFPKERSTNGRQTKPRAELRSRSFIKTFFGRETQLTLSSAHANTINSIEHTKQAEAAALKKTVMEHPTVAKMKEILGAEVVDVNVEV